MIYANENDPAIAAWLRRLPLGIDRVDDRSICDITGDDVAAYTQCHFFAGIGGWPLALQMAGWPADVPAWTGSCPCQPFSQAGRREGAKDDRHLWPVWFRLIDAIRPPVIFGEQVSSHHVVGRTRRKYAASLTEESAWWDVVSADLEAASYSTIAFDLPAASVGAPHIRQRIFWVAYADGYRFPEGGSVSSAGHDGPERNDNAGRLCDSAGKGPQVRKVISERPHPDGQGPAYHRPERPGSATGGIPDCPGIVGDGRERPEQAESHGDRVRQLARPSVVDDGCWGDVQWLPFGDGRLRPIKPGVRLLADGIPGRVAKIRGFGNAIVPQVAAAFVQSFMGSV